MARKIIPRETAAQEPRTTAYLRVSTDCQNTVKFEDGIRAYANERNWGRVEFTEETVSGRTSWRERKISQLIDELKTGDRLLVPELSRLGRSTIEVLEILRTLKERNVVFVSLKERFILDDSMQSKVMSTVFALVSELERDFISQRTKEALAARKAAGVKLGRPKGPGKSKLDPFRLEIEALLNNGSKKIFIAKRYGVGAGTLHHWLKMNNIKVEARP